MRTWDTLPPADIHDQEITGDQENGAELYDVHCIQCHGENGEGDSALSLNNPTFLESVSDGFLVHALTEGRSGTTMISYSQILTQQEMEDLVVYIRSLE